LPSGSSQIAFPLSKAHLIDRDAELLRDGVDVRGTTMSGADCLQATLEAALLATG
jgi:hypothetical protein